jgi:hypothetical protein
MTYQLKRNVVLLSATLLAAVALSGGEKTPAADQKYLGKWAGKLTTERRSAAMSLHLQQQEEKKWSGTFTAAMEGAGQETPLEDLKVTSTNVTFTAHAGATIKFSGLCEDGKLKGTMEAFEGGQKVGAGTWEVSPVRK